MADRSETVAFDEWVSDLLPAEFRRSEARRWYLKVFEEHGPVSKDVVHTIFQFDELAAAEHSLAEVLDDLHRTQLVTVRRPV